MVFLHFIWINSGLGYRELPHQRQLESSISTSKQSSIQLNFEPMDSFTTMTPILSAAAPTSVAPELLTSSVASEDISSQTKNYEKNGSAMNAFCVIT